jgi:tetratricopeptide (TPR) repeat protein
MYLDDLLAKGLKEFNQKNYSKSKSYFEQILLLDRENIKANHAMGVIYGSQNNHEKAKSYFEEVLKIDNTYQPSLVNLALSLYAIKNYEKAIDIYLQIIKSGINRSDIYLNLGNCFFKLSKYEEAINNLQKSLDLNSNQFEPLFNIGVIKKFKKNYEESLDYFLRAESLNKNNSALFFNIAETKYLLGDFDAAISYCKKSLEIDPENLNSLSILSFSYFSMENIEIAKKFFDELISKTKDIKSKVKYYQRAGYLIIKNNDFDFEKDYSLAYEYSDIAINLDPNSYTSYTNRAIAKYFSTDLNGALKDAEKANQLKSESPTTLKNLASFYKFIGMFDKAQETVEKYFKLFADDQSLNFMYSLTTLAQSKFDLGWEYYEARWFKETGAPRTKQKPNFEKPLWNPKMGYESILVWAEQGLGDQILHGTMLRDFKKKFKKVHLAIDPRLKEIFQEAFPDINVFSLFDDIHQDFFDYQIPLTSIGGYVRNKIDDFFPLISPFQRLVVDKKPFTPTVNNTLKCAISWKSSLGTNSKLKTVKLESLKKILQIKNIDFYNIQYQHDKNEFDEVLDFYKKYGIKILEPPVDAHNDLRGLVDFINTCDFVINISNTNAHLSGAIGKKTYLLLPIPGGRFWYWENIHEGKNLWYPSIEIFTQSKPFDWDDPIDRLFEKITTTYNLS